MTKDRFLTPPKAARILGTSAEQVLAFIGRGELKASNLSLSDRPRWKIDPADFRDFLDKRSNRKPATPAKRRRAISDPVPEYI